MKATINDLPKVPDFTIRNLLFLKYEEESGLWLVGICPNPADWIFFWPRDESNQTGFCGSKIKFKLIDGELELKGPWHSNADAFYHAIGIDLREKHYICGIISTEYDNSTGTYENILHIDKEWKVRNFLHLDFKAKRLAEKLNTEVYMLSKSVGGWRHTVIEP